MTREDQIDCDFKAARSEKCTFWTKTYPMHQFTIYAVGEGAKQYLRMDHFISGATGRQAEYVVVRSGMTYVWTTWSKPAKTGVKFPNAPVPFREYFGIDRINYRDFRCESWKPANGVFVVPDYVTFRPVLETEFERDDRYTPVLKEYWNARRK